MAKGNRTKSRRDPSKIKGFSEKYSDEVKGYKAMAEARRAMRKYDQTSVGRIYKQIVAYVADCKSRKEPLTIAGTMLATNTNKDIWYKARQEDLDYLLEEYISLNDITEEDIVYDDNGLPWDMSPEVPVLLIPWSELSKNRDLLIQEQLERNCYTNRGNPAGSIFSLKAQFNWQEESTPQHLVQQLVIADLDQAKKALEMLK